MIKRSAMSKALHNPALPTYHDTKGAMIAAIDSRLAVVGAKIDARDCMDLHGDTGHKVCGVLDEDSGHAGFISISWYRMPSGRYELTAYIA